MVVNRSLTLQQLTLLSTQSIIVNTSNIIHVLALLPHQNSGYLMAKITLLCCSGVLTYSDTVYMALKTVAYVIMQQPFTTLHHKNTATNKYIINKYRKSSKLQEYLPHVMCHLTIIIMMIVNVNRVYQIS